MQRYCPRYARGAAIVGLALLGAACGPHAHIPPRPVPVPGALVASEAQTLLAKTLAPVLYLQRDETFRLERVVAAVHPTRPVIAYYLLWRDDVHGAWLPFTIPTDEEVAWVGYDPASGEATEMWTYWHGKILHTPWRRGSVPAINVQWGKHGSLPRGTLYGDLPRFRTLNAFYAAHIIGAPDIWLSDIMRKGPFCFCHSFRRYREFTRVYPIADRLDAVVAGERPGPALEAAFGAKYSEKTFWPWKH